MLPSASKCSLMLKSSMPSSSTSNRLRYLHRSTKRKLVFGIETSCDDTAMAVVDDAGNILGEAYQSQLQTHVSFGGIIPTIARDLHILNIHKVHQDTLARAGIDPQEIDAVAVTNKPGMALSLGVGLEHAKRFCKENSLPLIPIHHMQAHALVVRCGCSVDFPYLVLLVSGGHCQVAVVRDVTDFALLGTTLDDAPGEALDKIARRLKLSNLREFRGLSGGASIEILAKRGNPTSMQYTQPMTHRRDCAFSFSGFKSKTQRIARHYEEEFGIRGDGVLPNVADVCASVQFYICQHIMKRVWRAMLYCRRMDIDFGNRLVISGGVACSTYLRMFMKQLCEREDVDLFVPPARLCSDNGVMIAWNGMERLRAGERPIPHLEVDELCFESRAPLGDDLTDDIMEEGIQIPRWKIDLGRLLKDTGNIFADEFTSAPEKTPNDENGESSEVMESDEIQKGGGSKAVS